MVDVKKVTASVKKPIYYAGLNTSVTDEYVNFNPTDNPIYPETASTVYTIDPFVIFQQESGKLKVKIPFSRFYRFKYAIGITNASPAALPSTIDQFSIAKPILVCTESLVIERESYNGITQIQTNVYNQDGSGFITYDPVMVGINITGYDIRKTLTPGIVEGIVELYAGDVLTFKHSRTIFKKSDVINIYGSNVILASPFNAPFPYSTPPDQGWGIADIPLSTQYPGVSVNSTAYIASASFFFEISEITDL